MGRKYPVPEGLKKVRRKGPENRAGRGFQQWAKDNEKGRCLRYCRSVLAVLKQGSLSTLRCIFSMLKRSRLVLPGWPSFLSPFQLMPKRKYLKSAPPSLGDQEPIPQALTPSKEEKVCALCARPLAGICNRHHLIPLSRGGRGTTTLLLHKICHDKIHAVLPESELQRYYNTIERLREQEDIAASIKWVQKKEPEFYDRSVRSWEKPRL